MIIPHNEKSKDISSSRIVSVIQWCRPFPSFWEVFFIILVMCHLMAAKWLPKFRHRSLTLPFVLSRKKEDTGQNYFCGRCLFLLLWLFCLFHVDFCLFRKQNLSWKLPLPPDISPYASFSRTRTHGHQLTSQWQREINDSSGLD